MLTRFCHRLSQCLATDFSLFRLLLQVEPKAIISQPSLAASLQQPIGWINALCYGQP
jgi:hypothetical protein